MTRKNRTILIVDDDPLMVRSVQKVLGKAFDEFTILTTSSGSSCLQLAVAEQPEVILLDVNMPDIDGFEVCRQLRSGESTKHIPVLMMTGERLESASRAAGLSLGADAYLFKPFGNAELIAQVQVIIRIKQTEDILRAQKESLERAFREQTIELQQSKEALQQKVLLLEKQMKEKTQSLIREDHFSQGSILAAGIAHEINNPNTFVASNVITFERFWQVLEPVLRCNTSNLGEPENEKIKFILAEMPGLLMGLKTGTQRIHAIVKGMKSYAGGIPGESRAIAVPALVKSAITMISHQIPASVMVITDMNDNLPKVWGSENMLMQVIVNLITNAVSAISDSKGKGTVTISASTDSHGHVVVSISDDGPGISPEMQEKLFTPFFTTRRDKGGTGLGLFFSNGIIKGHHGTLSVNSGLGQGSTFTITVPCIKDGHGGRSRPSHVDSPNECG